MFMYSNFKNCNLDYNCQCDPCCGCDPCYRNSSCESTCNTMAVAHVNGGPHHPNLKGIVYFFPVPCGTEVSVCIQDRKSTRLNSSHANISYAVFCLKKKHHYNYIL